MRSGFFNSDITGYDDNGMPIFDRAEDAEFFAKFFKSFFTNGVYPNPSTNLQVVIHEGMNVKALPGICLINGYYAWEELERVLAIQASESLDRIDRIVLRLNLADREIDLYVKKGTAAASPVAPALTRPLPNQGGDVYEMGLADVFITKNCSHINQEKITDLRLNSELCGVITQCVETIDTTTIFDQLKNQVDYNLPLIQSAIDGTTAGILQKEINQRAITKSFTFTLTSASWAETTAPFTQRIDIDWMKEHFVPIGGIAYSSDLSVREQEESNNFISDIFTCNGYIEAVCNNAKPEVDLNFNCTVSYAEM